MDLTFMRLTNNSGQILSLAESIGIYTIMAGFLWVGVMLLGLLLGIIAKRIDEGQSQIFYKQYNPVLHLAMRLMGYHLTHPQNMDSYSKKDAIYNKHNVQIAVTAGFFPFMLAPLLFVMVVKAPYLAVIALGIELTIRLLRSGRRTQKEVLAHINNKDIHK